MKLTSLTFVVTVTVGMLAPPLAAEAQQAGKVYKVGVLTPAWRKDIAHTYQAFEDELRGLGWVQGRNIVFEYRFANGQIERLPELAAELVTLGSDVIVAGTSFGAAAAKQATTKIPIVMGAVRDPVGLGLVASLPRPGGNLTGWTIDVTPETFGKNVQLLKEVVPHASRVAVLWNPTAPWLTSYFKAVEAAARKLGVEPYGVEVRGQGDFDAALAALASQRPAAGVVMNDSLLFSRHRQILDVLAKTRLPAVFNLSEWVEKGGLMSYGFDLVDGSRRGAHFIDKILRGAKPADLPVEQPTKFELVINRKTANALGLTIPPFLLLQADRVIE